MRLIQQHGEFAEYGTGLGHRGDLNPFFKDFDRAFLQNKQPSGPQAGSQYGLAGLIGYEWKTVEFFLQDSEVASVTHVAPKRGIESERSVTDSGNVHTAYTSLTRPA